MGWHIDALRITYCQAPAPELSVRPPPREPWRRHAAGGCSSRGHGHPGAPDGCGAAAASSRPPPPPLLVLAAAPHPALALLPPVEAYLTATSLEALEAEGGLLPHEARALAALRAAAAAAAPPLLSGTQLFEQLAASVLLSTVSQSVAPELAGREGPGPARCRHQGCPGGSGNVPAVPRHTAPAPRPTGAAGV